MEGLCTTCPDKGQHVALSAVQRGESARMPEGLEPGKSVVVAFSPEEPPGIPYVSGRYVINVELIAAQG